jgi:hypothetical protein
MVTHLHFYLITAYDFQMLISTRLPHLLSKLLISVQFLHLTPIVDFSCIEKDLGSTCIECLHFTTACCLEF